jgi:hypothetical protein
MIGLRIVIPSQAIGKWMCWFEGVWFKPRGGSRGFFYYRENISGFSRPKDRYRELIRKYS